MYAEVVDETCDLIELQGMPVVDAKVGQAIGNQNQLRPRPGQSSRKHSFWKTR
jgi:hypothetical protein